MYCLLLGLYFALVGWFVCLRFHFRPFVVMSSFPRGLLSSILLRAAIILFPFLFFSLDNNPVCLNVPAKVDRLILKKKKRKIVARLPHLSLALHLERR